MQRVVRVLVAVVVAALIVAGALLGGLFCVAEGRRGRFYRTPRVSPRE